jgi:hypothetical protein
VLSTFPDLSGLGGRMSSARNWAAISGYRTARQDLDYWHVEQIGPTFEETLTERAPRRSRTLSLWLDRLRDRPGLPAYRVCVASETK